MLTLRSGLSRKGGTLLEFEGPMPRVKGALEVTTKLRLFISRRLLPYWALEPDKTPVKSLKPLASFCETRMKPSVQ